MKKMSYKKVICFILLLLPILIFANNQRKFDTDFLIHIRVYEEKDQKFAKELKIIFSEQMEKFQKRVKHYPDIHVYIRITPNDDYYKKLIKDRGRVLEFSEGFTDTHTKEIFLKNPRSIRSIKKYSELVLHEYIHLYVDYFWSDAPLWFHEGMAVFFSEGVSFERYSDFMQFYAYKPMNLIKENPYNYPENPHFYSPYYFQSAQAVKELYHNNSNAFYSLWDYSHVPFDSAFIKAFHKTTANYLTQYDQEVKKNFLNGIIFLVITLIWASLPILVIIGSLRKRRINQRILEDWEKDKLTDYEEEVEEDL
ncbi:MAG TPA: hypothetical protein PL063_05360 [Candidatus Cloacimonadota bacterium]|nr:hypothetical protein [Candidatus Cloacimonadota bacterium]HQB40954.1 hypothetical protein [Candidatus Cloacimonadota bacterium]